MNNQALPDRERPAAPSWWKRLGWLVLIWSASVLVLGLVAALVKLIMNAVGLTVG